MPKGVPSVCQTFILIEGTSTMKPGRTFHFSSDGYKANTDAHNSLDKMIQNIKRNTRTPHFRQQD